MRDAKVVVPYIVKFIALPHGKRLLHSYLLPVPLPSAVPYTVEFIALPQM